MRPFHLLLPLLVGCGPDATESVQPTVPPSNPLAFYPSQGVWSREVVAVPEDGCNYLGNGGAIGDVIEATLWPEGSGFDIEGPTRDVTCTLDGQAFTCEPYQAVDTDGTTELTRNITYEGSFTDEADGELSTELFYECEGPACAEVEHNYQASFPCTTVVEQTLTKR